MARSLVGPGVVLAGSTRIATANRTAATTLTVNSTEHQPCDATSAAFTVTLPATTTPGYRFTIVKVDATANPVTVTPGTSINGYAGSVKLPRLGDSITVMSTTTSGVYLLVGGSINPIKPAPEILMTSGTPAAGDTVSGTALETAFATQVLLKANTVVAKSAIKLEGFGSFAYTTGATQEPKVRMGPTATAATSRTTLVDGGNISAFTGTSGAIYVYETWLQFRSVGTAASVASMARLTFVSMGSGQSVPFLASAAPAVFTGTATVDTTVDNMIGLTVDMSTAAAGNNNTLQSVMATHYLPSVYS